MLVLRKEDRDIFGKALALGWRSNEERETKNDMEEAGGESVNEGQFEQGRCAVSINQSQLLA